MLSDNLTALSTLRGAFIFASLIGLSVPVSASTAPAISIEIPRLQVAEYHRPYIAVWLSDASQQRIADIAVWYDVAMARDEGSKWLPDLRQWWRRSGRSLTLPVDGVSGATRPVGTHHIDMPQHILDQLEPGDYIVHIEAAREVGGREHLQLKFSVNTQGAFKINHSTLQGEHELGRVTLSL
ncbi:MAG: DUF2271 domain-containing protein [Idiomarina sp.]|nr:DUF2271 domain-containing protein [Idiomarina sp.]